MEGNCYLQSEGYEMTLNYWLIVESCPKPNGVVGGSIPDCEFVLST